MTTLYNENREELKDAKSFTEAETIIIYFSADENEDNNIEIYISEDHIKDIEIYATDSQWEAARNYAAIAQQSIIDYKNF